MGTGEKGERRGYERPSVLDSGRKCWGYHTPLARRLLGSQYAVALPVVVPPPPSNGMGLRYLPTAIVPSHAHSGTRGHGRAFRRLLASILSSGQTELR